VIAVEKSGDIYHAARIAPTEFESIRFNGFKRKPLKRLSLVKVGLSLR